MKKKLLSVLFLGILVFGLTGCGVLKNSSNSLEEMIKDAEILDWNDVHSIIDKNRAKAEDYENKLYVYTAKVYSIQEEYCNLEYNNTIQAYLDKETLKSLNRNDVITVIGKLTDLNNTPKLIDAVKLDNETIKDNFVMAITETSSSMSSRNMKYSDYKVDNDTHLVTSYKTSGASNGTHTLKYDKNGNLIEDLQEYTIKSYGSETITYTYNDDNTMATETYNTTKDGKTEQGNVWNFTYEKDSKDRVTKKTGVNITSDDKYTMVYTYEYDENDNIIKETQTSPRSTYIIDYEYDEFNNKIKETSYNADKPYSKSTTTHTYSIIAKK